MKEEYHKWYSQYLNKEFDMLVFGDSGFPVILFPPNNKRYYDAKDNGLVAAAADLINGNKIKLYCPDSIDSESWYNFNAQPNERVFNHIAYENSILFDVIAFAQHETEEEKVILAGCDFGGYHAANIAFKHPDKVSSLMTMGGFFNIKQFIFGYYDTDCYFNNPPDYLPNLNDLWYLEKINEMKIILGTGEFDGALNENKHLSELLSQKGIKHWLNIRSKVTHDWKSWHSMFYDYLSVFLM